MNTAEKQVRKDSVVTHLYVGMILLIVFDVIWIFALIGTQANITGDGSIATQYIFSFLAIIHSILLFVLTLVRTKDTREIWLTLLGRITGRTGKYAVASQSVRIRTTQSDEETYGLDASGKYLTDTTNIEGSTEEKQPLSDVSLVLLPFIHPHDQ